MLFLLVGLTSIAHAREREKKIIPWPPNLPVYDHIVIVVEENKDYEEVVGQNYAPYLNKTLKAEGADLFRCTVRSISAKGITSGSFRGTTIMSALLIRLLKVFLSQPLTWHLS